MCQPSCVTPLFDRLWVNKSLMGEQWYVIVRVSENMHAVFNWLQIARGILWQMNIQLRCPALPERGWNGQLSLECESLCQGLGIFLLAAILRHKRMRLWSPINTGLVLLLRWTLSWWETITVAPLPPSNPSFFPAYKYVRQRCRLWRYIRKSLCPYCTVLMFLCVYV